MKRRREAELMDQPGLDEQAHAGALGGLRRINRVSRSTAIVWGPIKKLAATVARPLRVLDVASGGGDVAVGVARRAGAAGVPIEIHGCDLSPFAVKYAAALADRSGAAGVPFFQLDALKDPLPQDYDVVMCSLFLHHLDEPEARELLGKMAAASRHLVLVNDLRRSRLGYGLAWLGCRLLSRSPIVHVDGPLSVQGAFTIPEVHQLAQQAGLQGSTVSRHWPQRFLLTWRRS